MTDRELLAMMAAILYAGCNAQNLSTDAKMEVDAAESILAEIDARAVRRSNVPQSPPKAE